MKSSGGVLRETGGIQVMTHSSKNIQVTVNSSELR